METKTHLGMTARIVLLFLHLLSPAILTLELLDYFSGPANIYVFIFTFVLYFLLILSIILHIKNFFIYIKNKQS